MGSVLVVALGGAAGSVSRHFVNLAAFRLFGSGVPVGTLTVNIAGSFVMGLLIELLALRINVAQEVRLFLTTGFLGGFTTFSTFSLDTAQLWERGDHLLAAGYVIASVVISLAALFAGLWVVRVLS